eukprot:scaffold216110_cov44-Attheya_sp.AAC.1
MQSFPSARSVHPSPSPDAQHPLLKTALAGEDDRNRPEVTPIMAVWRKTLRSCCTGMAAKDTSTLIRCRVVPKDDTLATSNKKIKPRNAISP